MFIKHDVLRILENIKADGDHEEKNGFGEQIDDASPEKTFSCFLGVSEEQVNTEMNASGDEEQEDNSAYDCNWNIDCVK